MNLYFLISLWIANSIFFYAAGYLFPSFIVLGNNIRDPISSCLLNGFVLTIILALVPRMLKILSITVAKESNMAFVYFIVNFFTIWLLARLADFTGFGISSFVVALILGAVFNIFQWIIWKTSQPKQNQAKSSKRK